MDAVILSERMIAPPISLGVVRPEERSALAIAALSRAALDLPLRCPVELCVSVVSDEALVIGAFQRGAGLPATWPLVRRGSGGPAVRVGPGTVHVAALLAHPGALVPCDEKRIVNRTVRPLLRALTRAGHLAHYFGRDWVSVAHRPVAWVGFAHDATTRRTLFEAFVAVRTPFAITERASFLGKPHATLESTGDGRPVDPARIAAAVVDAYARDASPVELDWPQPPAEPSAPADLRADPPWAATTEEAIGTLGAGPDAHGVFRVGGDLLVSRDALARLEARVASAADVGVGGRSAADVGVGGRSAADVLARAVDETLAAPGVALDGVRSLASVLDVISRARHG
jgi:hypothetical protein